MDKYVQIIEEPQYNLMINLKLLEKETLSKWCRMLKSYDIKRLNTYNLIPMYKQMYVEKPRKPKKYIKNGDITKYI